MKLNVKHIELSSINITNIIYLQRNSLNMKPKT